MSNRSTVLGASLGAIGLSLLATSEWSRRRGNTDRLVLHHTMPARPDRVVDLVSQVEREPELIPGVRRVIVMERGRDWVRYRVELAGGAFALYCKTWEEGRIAWSSEGGSLGLRQTGMMYLSPRGGSTDVELTVETSFDAPGIGPLVTAGSHPFAAVTFRAWLENLDRKLAAQALRGDD